MGITLQKITNANVYIGNNSLIGKVAEMQLPALEQEMTEQNLLGLYSQLELPSGLQALEATMTVNSMYDEIIDAFANPTQSRLLQLRTSRETWTEEGLSEEVPVVVFLRASCKNFPLGGFTPRDNVELELQHNVTFLKVLVDGEERLEVDAINNVYKVNGEDILQNFRSNLGA